MGSCKGTNLAVAQVGLEAAVDKNVIIIVVVAGAVVVVERPDGVVVGNDKVVEDVSSCEWD